MGCELCTKVINLAKEVIEKNPDNEDALSFAYSVKETAEDMEDYFDNHDTLTEKKGLNRWRKLQVKGFYGPFLVEG